MPSVLGVSSFRVAYSGRIVLDLAALSLDVQGAAAGFVLGANGAGKTTLINAISGYVPVAKPGQAWVHAGAGRVRIDHHRPSAVVRAGVGRTFQHPALSSLAVWQVIALANANHSFWELLRPDNASWAGVAFSEALGLAEVRNERLRDLPVEWLRRVELARVLASEPGIVFLDEPTAGADEAERAALAKFVADALPAMISEMYGRGRYRFASCDVWIVTHDIPFAQTVSASGLRPSPAVVLDLGTVVSTGELENVLRDPVVVDAWIGAGDEHALGV